MPEQGRTDDDPTVSGQKGEMATEFLAEKDVSPERASSLMKLAPANPFCMKSYADAMRADGHQAWLLGTKREGQIVSGCYGFIASGRLNRVLRVPSVPDVPYDDDFWDGLQRFSTRHRITCLEVGSFASTAAHIPPLCGEMERHDRCEYVLDLADPDGEHRVARHHRRKIQMAMQSGLALRRTDGDDACREHVRLMGESRERRLHRGESLLGDTRDLCSWFRLLMEKGAGELFQAAAGREVLSSVMVLRAAEGAYYETAGTSAAGRACGASHFLIYSVARLLREESMRMFNLGGAELDAGLSLFKSRFGARAVPLESARFYFGSDFRRKLTDAARFLRQSGTRILGRRGVSSL